MVDEILIWVITLQKKLQIYQIQKIQMFNRNNFPPLKEGKVVLITGGSSGLGKQLVLKLALKKVTLVIAARNLERLQQTKKQCQDLGCHKVIIFQGDLTSPQVCKKLIEMVEKRCHQLDFLVLNAGVNAHFKFQDLKELAVFQQIMKTNFFSNAYLTKAALPLIKKSKGGIVVISSLSGKFGLPMRSAYCASKFALNGFFQSLRTQQKIPILMVYPTSLQTPMRQNSLIKAENNSAEKRQDPKECAQLIIKGIQAQKEQVYMPWKGWIGVVLQPLFPRLLRWKVSRAAKL